MVDSQLALDENEGLDAYFNGEDLIILSGNWSEQSISIFTVDGKLVQRSILNNGQASISVSELKSGVYLFQAKSMSIKFHKP